MAGNAAPSGTDRQGDRPLARFLKKTPKSKRDPESAKITPRRFDEPASGTQISDRITLFHDADDGNFACVVGHDPFVRLTLYQFSGTYLSLAVALRKSDLRQARPGTELQLSMPARLTRPMTIFARLNLRTPEQTETLYETLVLYEHRPDIRFPLDGVRVPHDQIEAGWVDVIFSDPAMAEVNLASLDVSVDALGGRA